MRTRWQLGDLVRSYYINPDKEEAVWDQNNGDERYRTLKIF